MRSSGSGLRAQRPHLSFLNLEIRYLDLLGITGRILHQQMPCRSLRSHTQDLVPYGRYCNGRWVSMSQENNGFSWVIIDRQHEPPVVSLRFTLQARTRPRPAPELQEAPPGALKLVSFSLTAYRNSNEQYMLHLPRFCSTAMRGVQEAYC